MIDLEKVSFAYPRGGLIFQEFSLHVDSGEAWAVLGPSACGKTTLLYLLAGLQMPVSGGIRIGGQPLIRPRPYTGLILQDYGLLPWATVYQNAQLGLRLRRFYGPDGKHAPYQPGLAPDVHPWLERLGISAVAGRFPPQISGGQRQRTAIARTLALEPDLLLMDEPFSSLDAPTRAGLQELAIELWREQHFTLVIVTHSIEEAAFLGRKILVLGKPPHTSPRIVENPQASQADFRDSPAYLGLCHTLRSMLEVDQA